MLDATLDQLNAGVIVIDTNCTIVFLNTAGEKYLGIKKDEALHQNIKDLFQSKFNSQPYLPAVLSTKKSLSRTKSVL